MGTTKLKRLKIKAFRSFESTTVDFPDSGLMLVRGMNHDTHGSSGSGKSSIVLALSYVLGYCPFPRTALQSWLTEEPMSVEATLQTPEGEVVITRGQKLSLEINGQAFKGGAAAIEAKLQELIGLPPEMVAALTYRAQRSPGLFLSKGDSEKKEFLSTLLGLDKIEEAVDAAQAQITKTLEPDYKMYSTQTSIEKTRLDEIEKVASARPTEPDVSGLAAQVDKLKHDYSEKSQAAQKVRDAKAKNSDDREAAIFELHKSFEPERLVLDKKLTEANSLTYIPQVSEQLTNLRTLESEAGRRLRDALSRDEDRRSQHRAKVADFSNSLRVAQSVADTAPRLKKDIESIEEQVQQLEKNICPTCHQKWINADLQKDELTEKLGELKRRLESANRAVVEVTEWEQRIASLGEFTPDPNVAKMAQIQAKLQTQITVEEVKANGGKEAFVAKKAMQVAQIIAEIEKLKNTENNKRSDVESSYREKDELLRTQLDALLKEATTCDEQRFKVECDLREAQSRYSTALAVWKSEQAQLERQRKAFATAQEKALEVEKKINAEKDFIKLVGREGFLGSIFDEVLEEISSEANRILAAIPNTSHVTLQFKTETLTQNKTIKRAIVPVVSIGGHEAPLKSGLSGGMTTSVELAVDLAVSAVIARRSGCNPQWLVLDESFDGLGVIEKEACMEILKRFGDDKLVIVIDHMNETKELFQNFINVKCENGRSEASVIVSGGQSNV